MIRVLFIGESWQVHVTEAKGFDVFTYDYYEEAVESIRDALVSGGVDFTHIPSHRVEYDFPKTPEALAAYDVVMISDCGANTFNLPMSTFQRLQVMPNKLHMLRDFVAEGGALVMIGGYLTFSGIQARGAYKSTAVEEVLPVELLPYDDRRENCQGVRPVVLKPEHPILRDVPAGEWPCLLGYNALTPKADAEVLATVNGDPLIAVHSYGRGRSVAFAGDCAPHWCPPDFVGWEGYRAIWNGIVRWAANKE